MKWRKKIIMLKIETTYGTDAVPTGAANAILASDIQLTPLAAETVERDNTRPELGAYQKLHVGEHVMLEFDVEMAGAGSAGGIPAYGPCLRACMLAETNSAGVNTQYDPVSEGEEAATIYIPFDGQLHKMVGAKGAWSFRVNKKGIPKWHFSMLGLWVDPASVADPTPVYTAFTAPQHVSNTNSPIMQLHGNDLKVSSLEVSSGNQVIHRDLIGVEEIAITDRQVTGKIKFEAPLLSAFNVFTTARANTLGLFIFRHGNIIGNIIQHDAPKVQILNPQYSEEDGQTMIDADLLFAPNAGDDEYQVTIQ